ncbi:pentapeptide repeat-containing protein [Microcoleus sp.]|uniref:pentapeptide repeat-containing protein n=1 Tax=Microcoleus sp. TaxID=44472 RepID=UPI003525C4B5
MTLVNRKQISLYEEAEAGLNSLVKQTAQVGVGLLGMLLLTGGNPPALTVGLSVVGGIAFVAWSEEKRLTKFYARQTQLIHNSVIASETKQSQLKYDPVIASETKQSQPHNSSESESLANDIKQIIEADTDNLSELVKQAGLNPYEDLAGADLSGVKGVGCKLSRFNLSGADLDHADLSRADLSFANLSNNAKLTNVKLCRADLSGADLRNALLMDADLSFADLSGADLSGADLINADLSNVNLSNTNLHNANLTSTNLNTAKVENARFGNNAGLDDKAKYELEQRGAIFPQDERIAVMV